MQAAEPETSQRFGQRLLGHRTFRQLVKFGLVGATGFVINVSVFVFCLQGARPALPLRVRDRVLRGGDQQLLLESRVDVPPPARGNHIALQGARFFAVSLVAAAADSSCSRLFVRSGMPKIPAEMLAVALVVPISFLGNKHWSFR